MATADALVKEQEDEIDEEVVKDMFGGKDHVSIIFMGHVDAGKSTMGGNILYLTGSVDKRTVENTKEKPKMLVDKVGICLGSWTPTKKKETMVKPLKLVKPILKPIKKIYYFRCSRTQNVRFRNDWWCISS